MSGGADLQPHRFPQSKAIDAVRWLPQPSAFHRLVAAAVHDVDSEASSVEIHALTSQNPNRDPDLRLRSSWTSPSRITSLKASHKAPLLLAASTASGSLHFVLADPVEGTVDSELSVAAEEGFHRGPISAVDIQITGGGECVSVGEDGRVNLASVGESGVGYRRVFDSKGLASYASVRWGSPAEFVTGGLGFGLHWWDQRRPGGPVTQFKSNWARGAAGIVHSIDIHPSRKHACVVGGSCGTVFSWDLRWPQQPVFLSGSGLSEPANSPSESEVWEVHYDSHIQSSNTASTTKILPVMMCSEDGILATLEQGGESTVVLAEPCAINTFDIDPQNPSDVICGLEWESIAILTRPRDSPVMY
ncbi:hypothetical protein QJS04_geneDACA013632 [Acorus gramineus]|uniref:Nucleoporin Nup43 n=1 Tax=Acorus gramineus TaxID=55184 RepID=A0AAV9AWP3_ACOGR|nr:hypothetical protein QJS04_geneDACA013632 [Acorus gramineus]